MQLFNLFTSIHAFGNASTFTVANNPRPLSTLDTPLVPRSLTKPLFGASKAEKSPVDDASKPNSFVTYTTVVVGPTSFVTINVVNLMPPASSTTMAMVTSTAAQTVTAIQTVIAIQTIVEEAPAPAAPEGRCWNWDEGQEGLLLFEIYNINNWKWEPNAKAEDMINDLRDALTHALDTHFQDF